MKQLLLLILAPFLISALKFKQFLRTVPQKDHNYLVYLTLQDLQRCSLTERYFFQEFKQREFENTTILESTNLGLMMALGVEKQDLPTYRLVRNNKVYSLSSVETQSVAAESNLTLQVEVQLPISYLQFSLLPFQQSRYTSIVRTLLGYEKKSSLSLLLFTVTLFGIISYIVLRFVMKELLNLGSQEISGKNTRYLFVLWMMVKVLLIPADTIDLMYHHNWKLIVYNFPVQDYYKPVCFGFDYPPLFLLFQGFWGTVIGLITPKDMQLNSLFKESNLFFLLIRVSVIITDIFYFWAVLSLMHTIAKLNLLKAKKEEKQTNQPLKVNMFVFSLSVFDTGLLAIDNANCQYNSFLFGITLFSINFMLQKRYLLSAFVYCIVILTKHITLYYGFGYFAFLLLHYCVTISKSASISINLSNSVKLATIVLFTFAVVLLPFLPQLDRMRFLLGGGNNNLLGYPVPNFQFLYSLSQLLFEQKYTHVYLIPGHLKLVLLVISYSLILKLVYSERSSPRFPFYMFLSGLAIFNFMDYAHQKHLLYIWIPLLVQGLLSGGELWDLVIEFKMFNSLVILNHLYNMELLTVKYPFLFCTLFMTRHFLPHKFKKYAWYIVLNEVPYDLGMVFLGVEIPYRFFVVFVMGMGLFYKVIRV